MSSGWVSPAEVTMAAQESYEWRGWNAMDGKYVLTGDAHFNGQTTAKVLGFTLFLPERKKRKKKKKSPWPPCDVHCAMAIASPPSRAALRQPLSAAPLINRKRVVVAAGLLLKQPLCRAAPWPLASD